MAEKSVRTLSSAKTVTTLMAYAQLEIDNSSTCIPRYKENFVIKYNIFFCIFRLCKFSIARVVLNRTIDGGDSNAIVIAVKFQVNIWFLIIGLGSFLFN
jgi:hypothetical protein